MLSGNTLQDLLLEGYVMRDNHAIVIMAKGKQIGDNLILVAECLVVRKTILVPI